MLSHASDSRRAIQSPGAILLFMFVTLATVAGDLGLKVWSFEHVAGVPVQLDPDRPGDEKVIPYHSPIVVVPKVLHLQLTTNTGAVFGKWKGQRMLFIVVSIIAVGVIGYLFLKSGDRAWLGHIFLALILAGAIGNLYDRIVYAQVRDMLHLFPELGLWPWIFNLADAALMVGVGGILLLTWQHRSEPASSPTETDV